MPPALKQISLFPSKTTVPGLQYFSDHISPAQEAALIQEIDQQPWLSDLKRRVQHYGYKYDYKARAITHDLQLGRIPDFLAAYCEQLADTGIFKQPPDQVIINEYLPGQGITPHVDCVPCFGDTIVSLSLGSPCVMEFSQPDSQQKEPVLLEPKSLVVLSGDARYKWRHAIPQRKTDSWNGQQFDRSRRISLTFRTVILSNS